MPSDGAHGHFVAMFGTGQPRVVLRTVSGVKRDCFASLPEEFALQARLLPQPVPLEVVDVAPPHRRWRVAWAGQTSSASDCIELSQEFASSAGMRDGLFVRVHVRTDLPRIVRATVIPESEGDWDVVGFSAEASEEQILSQIGIIEEGLVFPLWINNRTLIRLKVLSVEPGPAALLVVGSELTVLQPEQKVKRKNSHLGSTLGAGKLLRIYSLSHEDAVRSNLLLLQNEKPKQTSDSQYWDTSIARVNSITVLNFGWENRILVKVVPRALVSNGKQQSSAAARCKPVYLQIICDNSIAEGHIAVAPSILASLGAEELQKVLLFPYEMEVEDSPQFGLELCRLYSNESTHEDVSDVAIPTEQVFSNWLLVMLASKIPTVITLSKGLVIHMKAQDEDLQFYVNRILSLTGDSEEELHSVCLKRSPDTSDKLDVDILEGSPVVMPPVDEIHIDYQEWWTNSWLEKGRDGNLEFLRAILDVHCRRRFDESRIPYPGGVLLYGPSGSGKTVLSKSICNSFVGGKHMVKPVWLECETLSGSNITEVKNIIQIAFAKAVECQPSLMVFDNIGIFHNAQAMTQESLESFQFEVISEFVADMIASVRASNHAVAFLANSRSLGSVHECLKKSGCFDHHSMMLVPSDSEKGEIFAQLALSKDLEIQEDALKFMIKNCDGCDIADMESIIELCLHGLLSQFISKGKSSFTKENKMIMSKEDIKDVVSSYVPAKARGVAKVVDECNISSWTDIKGMPEACQQLEEALSSSSKYSDLLQQCPLRLRTGAMLYGPPGCGKTFIVRAAAKVCNLRVISIKGPELLNKYIGASEAGVRDLFRRASAAAPCILFFDEFDAIAPKRGHDNTGVTDRVVNQFLTELDGVESLVGVFVIAATSRPDLIDVALLRPGRLDRMIFCPFPDEKDRFDILTGACKDIQLSSDVGEDTLLSIARSTGGYSGADLISIVTDAQLEAAKAQIDLDASSAVSPPLITSADLLLAADKSGPSLRGKDREQLDRVYDTFNGSKSPKELSKGKNVLRALKRVTHA